MACFAHALVALVLTVAAASSWVQEITDAPVDVQVLEAAELKASSAPTFLSASSFSQSFQSNSYLNEFELQYDYKDHSASAQKKHFKIMAAPDGSTGLRIHIASGDGPLRKDSSTRPRSELSLRKYDAFRIRDGVTYSATWDQYISQYGEGYQYCFAQVFSANNGPNVMLDYSNGKLHIRKHGSQGSSSYSPSQDLNQWVSWRMDFHLSGSGFVKVYRNQRQLIDATDDFSAGGQSWWKQGIYTQGESTPVQDMTLFIRNLQISSQ